MLNNKTKNYSVVFLSMLLMLSCMNYADSGIRLNSLGFLPDMPKRATIVSKCSLFQVKRASDDEIVYSGIAAGPIHQNDVNQDVWIADFSQVRANGVFYLEIPDVGCSIEFKIGSDVYDEAYYTVMRGFYLWRCGTAVEGQYHGVRYAHAPCHMEDGWLDYIGAKDTRRDGTGGWHDAGDYGKYTGSASVSVAVLFMAWERFEDRLKTISLDVPETAPGYPDFLKEVKWETDWLLKMQYPDGSGKVSHKLTCLHFSGFVMPENDTRKRYFSDWSSTATADFVVAMAMAARHFKPYDADYADTCLTAAIKSYDFLKKNPQDKRPDLQAFSTGGYSTPDVDDRLWAAAQMWDTTGKPEYLKDFENRVTELGTKVEHNWDWANVEDAAIFTYLLSERQGRDPELYRRLRNELIETADAIVRQAKDEIYARPFGALYYWGCNGAVARQTILLLNANKIEPKEAYVQTSLDAIGHLFGRNYYGRSYVTGLGNRPPMHTHDRRSGADDIEAPWPGYLVGGGESATGWEDDQGSFRTNEVAINWQAALIYALAGFINNSPR